MTTNPFDSDDPRLFDVSTRGPGPKGALPLTPQMLRERPSGDLFGWTQNAGMGWNPSALGGKEFLMLSTHGGIRAADGTPIALGYHTGHWEVGLLLEAAAAVFKNAGAIPFAAACTDPCDGRSQGTTAMFDSLPFRNDAATIFRRLIRSLPTRRGVLGVATCDKGLPAMMMALAASHDLPAVLVPGGVTLLARAGRGRGKGSDAWRAIRARRCDARGSRRPRMPRMRIARRWVSVPRHRGNVAGRRGSAGHVARPFRARAVRAPDLDRHGAPFGYRADDARTAERQDRAMSSPMPRSATRWSCSRRSADRRISSCTCPLSRMQPGCGVPSAAEWAEVNRMVPRLVDALPNGPRNHPTVQVFMAGGVPEVMLHLRRLGLLDTSVKTVSGGSLDAQLDAWESSERRTRLRAQLKKEGVDPEDVIVAPELAPGRGLTSTVCFPQGNLAPEGSVIKSTAIDPSVVGADGVYRLTGPAKVFLSEPAAMAAIKAKRDCARRCAGADRPGTDGRGHGRDLSDHERVAAPAVRQACRRHHGRAVQRRVDRRMRGPHLAGSAGGWAGRQTPRRRHDRDRRRSHGRSKARSTSSERTAPQSASKRDRASSTRVSRAPTSPPIRRCPTTRASGRLCRM